MKGKTLYIALAAVVLMMVSCSKVKEPFLKETTVEGNRVVLLEDYTGVKCPNCPEAHEIAEELLAMFPNNLVVMSIHAGDQSNPAGGFPDFRTEAGNTWYNNAFNFDHNPVGTVNRTRNVNGGYGFEDGAWGTKVAEEMAREQEASLSIATTFNETSRELSVTLNTCFLKEIEGDFYIFAGLLEDSIQGKQLSQSTPALINDYWHRNVFRTPINGTWGQSLFNGLTEINQEFETNLNIAVDNNYREDQCYVVSYIYDNGDKHVIQVGKAKIK